MASLRSLVISLLRLDGHTNIGVANRHHARDPQRTLKLLQPHERLCRVPGPTTDPGDRRPISPERAFPRGEHGTNQNVNVLIRECPPKGI
jgi:hypothetical protein